MRKILIAGNWKMFKTVQESVTFAKALREALAKPVEIDVAVCPPFPSLFPVSEVLSGSVMGVGAQDLHWEEEGAFTGEVSPGMLKAAGCQYTLVGHSERRAYFSETNAVLRQKLKAALRGELIPILCVGERLEEREKNKTFQVIENHLSVFEGLDPKDAAKVVIAYEPVWAIGTGKTATPQQAQEVHAYIRRWVEKSYDATLASNIRILYGGSVKPDNIEALLGESDIDGALVGGASLEVKSFLKIVEGGLSRMKVRVS